MPASDTAISDANTSRFVRIDQDELKMQLHYNDIGEGEQAIVILHGSGPGATSWANFSRNIAPLSEAGYRLILLDCPGWGKSDSVVCSGSRSELNASAVLGLMEALGLESAHLIGNSMGAHSAVAFALAHPKRVNKLVLMGGGTGGISPNVPMPTEGIKRLQALYRSPNEENLRQMMRVFIHDARHLSDELLQARLNNMLDRPDHLENFVRSIDANPRQFPDLGHRLGEIDAATLVIWGRDDRFVPMDVGLRLLAGLQDAELHIFSRCGHWAQWEHADKFNRMVLDFLAH